MIRAAIRAHVYYVAVLGRPPWRRVYGFRSDPNVLEEIEQIRPLGARVSALRACLS